jgi:hypothetical protein
MNLSLFSCTNFFFSDHAYVVPEVERSTRCAACYLELAGLRAGLALDYTRIEIQLYISNNACCLGPLTVLPCDILQNPGAAFNYVTFKLLLTELRRQL